MLILAAGALTPHQITLFLLEVGILLGLAKLLGEAARALRQPSVLGEIAAGVILGPTVLGAFFPGAYHWLFPMFADASEHAYHFTYIGLEALITLSVVLLLLIAGLEVDLSSIWKQGKAALLVSVTGIVIPFVLGFALAWTVPGILGHGSQNKVVFSLFVGIALSITALPVLAKILIDTNLAKSDFGSLIMSSAMINDLTGWIGFALVLAMMHTGGGGGHESGAAEVVDALAGNASAAAAAPVATVGITLLLTGIFIIVVLTLGRWFFHKSLPWVQAHLHWPGGVLVYVLSLVMLCAALTEWIGIHSIFGAFIFGVAAGDSDRLTNRTRETIHEFIINVFAPLFFASIGLRISFIESFDWLMVITVLLVAIVGKVVGCYLGARWARMAKRESWAAGFGMAARGTMEIILGQLAYEQGLISEEMLVALIIMALVTSMMSGPAMEWLLKHKSTRGLASAVAGDGFVPVVQSSHRRPALVELSHVGAEVTGVDAHTIFQAIWRREQIVSTGLEHGIAVPHARLPELTKSFVVVGLSEQGIDFNASDGEPARIICMLLTPADNQTAQIELLEMVARAFATPAARGAVLHAKTYTEFKAALAVTTPNRQEIDHSGTIGSQPTGTS